MCGRGKEVGWRCRGVSGGGEEVWWWFEGAGACCCIRADNVVEEAICVSLSAFDRKRLKDAR